MMLATAARLLLMEDGQIVADGPTTDILDGAEARRLFGEPMGGVLLEGRTTPNGVMVAGHSLYIDRAHRVPASLNLQIRSRDVALARTPVSDCSIRNQLPVTLAKMLAHVMMGNDGPPLRSLITKASADALALKPGDRLYALIKAAAVLDLDITL